MPEEKREEFRGEGEKAARGRSRLMDAILECRPFMLFPEETRVHLLESQKETLLAIRGFIDAAISEENIRHMVEARRELGLAVRSIVDEAIENIEEQERKETEGPTKVPVE